MSHVLIALFITPIYRVSVAYDDTVYVIKSFFIIQGVSYLLTNHFILTCRAAVSERDMEGGKDPGDLSRGAAFLRGQPTAAEVGHDLREAAQRADGAADARQPELRDVLLAQTQEQEAAAVPGRDLGRRHEDIVELTRALRDRVAWYCGCVSWGGFRVLRAILGTSHHHHQNVGCEILLTFFYY